MQVELRRDKDPPLLCIAAFLCDLK